MSKNSKTGMKPEIRILGIDDSPFDKFRDKDALVVGVLYRGGNYLDGVISTRVTVDGDDATNKLVEMVNRSKFKEQLRCIMLDGISLGGFNVVNIEKLRAETKVPVIVVMRNYPDFEKLLAALTKLGEPQKIQLIRKAGKVRRAGKVHMQVAGISVQDAQDIMALSATHSNIPEPLRVAHLISAGIVMGESKGRA